LIKRSLTYVKNVSHTVSYAMADSESKLKMMLMNKLRHGLLPASYVALRHEDRTQAGYPDISITGNRLTSWWEVKLAVPQVKSRGIQDLMMLRLGKAGIAFYIIYEEIHDIKQVRIIDPPDLPRWKESTAKLALGFDHAFVAHHMLLAHGQGNT
jgi:hypothetical protein